MSTPPSLLGPRRLRDLLARHDVRPVRSRGQNFVIDPNVIRKIISIARLTKRNSVLEIGAGAGSLTLGLSQAAASVVAVEQDKKLLPVLAETLHHTDNVRVLELDALQMDFGSMVQETLVESAEPLDRLVANLPYNIAATLVLKALDEAPWLQEFTVMTQREVGERLAAGPGSKAYGQTSVLVSYFATAMVAAPVSRRSFWPVPNVDSVIVRIVRHGQSPQVDRQVLFSLIRAAFAQRRKTLRNALESFFDSPEAAEHDLRRAGIEPKARGEELTLQDFVSIARGFG